ncbi:MAG: transcriptional regulator [Rhodocyclaceae bacterium]|nr:MAG: transcriptional regulator [Rhodocyclaceae bacterium]
MFACFDAAVDAGKLDREAFKFGHRLLGHPSLSLENLGAVLPALPKNQVMFSKTPLATGDNFEATFRARPAGQSLEDTIETIRTSSSYIMVRSPEVHPSFAELHRQLVADAEILIGRRGVGGRAEDAQLYLFIASPNAVTPFHIDRYSTFLMQFRGTKSVTVFPQWDQRVVPVEAQEAYVDYASTQLPWTESLNAYGQEFTFAPGEALHIPFVAGHYVKNGGGDVSISMSLIFNTRESMMWRRAICFNHRMRKRLSLFGMTPFPVGQSPLRDGAKSFLYRVGRRTQSMLGQR